MTDTDDHTLLARIDERVATLIDNQNRLEEWMAHQETRICNLEACQNQSTGRSAGIAAVISGITVLGGFLLAIYTGLLK